MLSSGTRIGPSRIESWLGDGSCGQSYQCLETEGEKKGSKAYVKLISREVSERKGFGDYFLQECQALEQLSGPGIWPVVKFGVMKWKHWIFYPWMEGKEVFGSEQAGDGEEESKSVHLHSLTDYLEHRIEKIDPEALLQIMKSLHQAFARAHQCGVLHGNLKPSNVLVRESEGSSWEAWVTEFGLWKMKAFAGLGEEEAEPSDCTNNLRVQQSIDETTRFRPPGMTHKEIPTERTDLFALGQIVEWIISLKGCAGEKDWEDWLSWSREATLGEGFPSVAHSLQAMPGVEDLSEFGLRLESTDEEEGSSAEELRIQRERQWAFKEKSDTLKFRRNMTGLIGAICLVASFVTNLYVFLRPSPWSEYSISMEGVLDSYKLGAGVWSGQAWGIVPGAYDEDGKGGQDVVGEWEKEDDLFKLSFRKFKINPEEEGDKKLWQFIGTGKTTPDDYHNWQDFLRFDRSRDALILVKRVDEDSEYRPGSFGGGKPRLFPVERFKAGAKIKEAELAFVHQDSDSISWSLFFALGFLLACSLYHRELKKLQLAEEKVEFSQSPR